MPPPLSYSTPVDFSCIMVWADSWFLNNYMYDCSSVRSRCDNDIKLYLNPIFETQVQGFLMFALSNLQLLWEKQDYISASLFFPQQMHSVNKRILWAR